MSNIFTECSSWGSIVAALAALIAYMQWLTTEKKRKQDLFEKRYEFYQKLKDIYYSLDDKSRPVSYCQIEDICGLMSKAEWLFGNDLKVAINDLQCSECDEIDKSLDVLPDKLEKVFFKYMKIERCYSVWSFLWVIILFFVPNWLVNMFLDVKQWFFIKFLPVFCGKICRVMRFLKGLSK